MRIVLHVPTASVFNNQPSEWFKQRLDTGIDYAKSNQGVVGFVVAGRWNNVTDTFELTEAEVAKRYILSHLPDAVILKEEIDVETAGGFAFAKPLIASLQPDKVVIFNSEVNANRIRFFAQKIFADAWINEFIFVNDSFSRNPRAQQKEPKALQMFQELFKDVRDGDDQAIREILLYKTPFYYKGLIDDKAFFDTYWEGGFADFSEKRLSINNQ